jgi:hypothetical protein
MICGEIKNVSSESICPPMDENSGPSFSGFLTALAGIAMIGCVGMLALAFLVALPAPAFLLGAAVAGCAVVFSGIRFISRILDPREARRPPDPP